MTDAELVVRLRAACGEAEFLLQPGLKIRLADLEAGLCNPDHVVADAWRQTGKAILEVALGRTLKAQAAHEADPEARLELEAQADHQIIAGARTLRALGVTVRGVPTVH